MFVWYNGLYIPQSYSSMSYFALLGLLKLCVYVTIYTHKHIHTYTYCCYWAYFIFELIRFLVLNPLNSIWDFLDTLLIPGTCIYIFRRRHLTIAYLASHLKAICFLSVRIRIIGNNAEEIFTAALIEMQTEKKLCKSKYETQIFIFFSKSFNNTQLIMVASEEWYSVFFFIGKKTLWKM